VPPTRPSARALANEGTQDAEVTATFLRENGTTVVKMVTVPAQSRVNLAVAGAGSDVPESEGPGHASAVGCSSHRAISRTS
jgi:hypothetical protein